MTTTRAFGGRSSFPALGTTAVVVVTDDDRLDDAVHAVEEEIAAVDVACSRFRADSELSAVNAASGRPVDVSTTFLDALDIAIAAATVTGGLVDPTVGRAMRLLGYDRDFSDVARSGPPLRVTVGAVPGWRLIRLDRDARRVSVPAGVELDLGATAKAWCADRAAVRAAEAVPGVGVLVSLGGDIAVAGPPPVDGWPIRLADAHDAPTDGPGPVITLTSGGLATSSTTQRRWQRGDEALHHVLDPSTGHPVAPWWQTVSVAASTCAGANVASTAAIILGDRAVEWLESRSLPARLVRHGDAADVVTLCGWPEDNDSVLAVGAP